MIVQYLGKEKIVNFDGISFVVREEPFNKRVIIDFFNKKIPEEKKINDIMRQAEIYVTSEEEIIISHQRQDSSSQYYTVVTGPDARELSQIMAEEIAQRNRNLKFFHEKLMTKSTPPEEIKLPGKKNG